MLIARPNIIDICNNVSTKIYIAPLFCRTSYVHRALYYSPPNPRVRPVSCKSRQWSLVARRPCKRPPSRSRTRISRRASTTRNRSGRTFPCWLAIGDNYPALWKDEEFPILILIFNWSVVNKWRHVYFDILNNLGVHFNKVKPMNVITLDIMLSAAHRNHNSKVRFTYKGPFK